MSEAVPFPFLALSVKIHCVPFIMGEAPVLVSRAGASVLSDVVLPLVHRSLLGGWNIVGIT